MRKYLKPASICIVLSLVICKMATSFYTEEFVFENGMARLVITGEGRSRSLFDKTNNKELLPAAAMPFASVRLKDGRAADASSIKRDGNNFRVEFGSTGVTARYNISAAAEYFLIRLIGVEGPDPIEIQFARLQLIPLANGGSWIVSWWNDQVAVSMMGLSAQVDARLLGTSSMAASLYSDFGFAGGAAAIIVAPTTGFMKAVHNLELEQKLPYCRLNGQWGKTSADVRSSYLFTNMTEANVDEVIRIAKLGRFQYILIDSGTWSQSPGSYQINSRNYPGRETGLAAVAEKCHRAGLKVGLHMMTSLVGLNDPLVKAYPSMLLKDAQGTLAQNIGEKDTEIAAGEPIGRFIKEGVLQDIQIGEELVHCARAGGPQNDRFMNCTRGFAGTKAAPHKSGERIQSLWRYGAAYFIDLKTPLMTEVSARIADLINGNRLDMVYFDAGELNFVNGPFWYWGGRQQMDIWERVRGDLLVQGSGSTPWSWHAFCRYTCDDMSATAVKQYIDYHKIAVSMKYIHDNFMPADLGWWGIWTGDLDRRATTPDEAELLGARSVAFDTPFSLETHLETLKANGRTEEMLALLSQYERLRLSRKVRAETRNLLRSGEWHLVDEGSNVLLYPAVYSSRYVSAPATIKFTGQFQAQPFRFRFEAVPVLDKPGSAANKVLCETTTGFSIAAPPAQLQTPGFVGGRFQFLKSPGPQPRSAFFAPAASAPAGVDATVIDLRGHRALSVTLKVERGTTASTESSGVLNIQLESSGWFRDHYINVDFAGERTVILREPDSERLLSEFPQPSYPIKRALLGFDYSRVNAINVRWMKSLPPGVEAKLSIMRVEALAESSAPWSNPELLVNDKSLKINAVLQTGDYAEFWGNGSIRIFDRNGNERDTLPQPAFVPTIRNGENTIIVKNPAPADVRLTTIVLGKPLAP